MGDEQSRLQQGHRGASHRAHGVGDEQSRLQQGHRGASHRAHGVGDERTGQAATGRGEMGTGLNTI